jgi:predicted dehydrogenase
MWSTSVLRTMARVEGTKGTMRVFNPIAPQVGSRLTVDVGGRKRRVRVAADGATYDYQLRAFVAAVRDGIPTLTPPTESVANMKVIDTAYRAAGLEPRRPS